MNIGFISNKMPEKVFDLLNEMKMKPDQVTMSILFNACAQLRDDRARKIGEKLLDEMTNSFENRNRLLNSAIHMLMRFGNVQRAEHMFQLIKNKDTFTYGIMINGWNFCHYLLLIYEKTFPFRLCWKWPS